MSVKSVKMRGRCQRLALCKRRVNEKLVQATKEKEEFVSSVESYFEMATSNAKEILQEISEQRFFEPSMYQRSMTELDNCCEKLFLMRMNLLEICEGSDAEEDCDDCSNSSQTRDQDISNSSRTSSVLECAPAIVPGLVIATPLASSVESTIVSNRQTHSKESSCNALPLYMAPEFVPSSLISAVGMTESCLPSAKEIVPFILPSAGQVVPSSLPSATEIISSSITSAKEFVPSTLSPGKGFVASTLSPAKEFVPSTLSSPKEFVPSGLSVKEFIPSTLPSASVFTTKKSVLSTTDVVLTNISSVKEFVPSNFIVPKVSGPSSLPSVTTSPAVTSANTFKLSADAPSFKLSADAPSFISLQPTVSLDSDSSKLHLSSSNDQLNLSKLSKHEKTDEEGTKNKKTNLSLKEAEIEQPVNQLQKTNLSLKKTEIEQTLYKPQKTSMSVKEAEETEQPLYQPKISEIEQPLYQPQKNSLSVKKTEIEAPLYQPEKPQPAQIEKTGSHHKSVPIFPTTINFSLEVSYNPPMCIQHRKPAFGRECRVIVTHVNNPTDLYVQLDTEGTTAVLEVFRLRFNSDNAVSIPALHEPVISGYYLAQSGVGVNKIWNRVKILDKQKDTKRAPWYKVFFLDYGNSELVPFRSLGKLDEELTDYPPLALHCALSRIQQSGNDVWSFEEAYEIKGLIGSKGRSLLAVFQDRLGPEEGCAGRSSSEAQYSIELWFPLKGSNMNVSDYWLQRKAVISSCVIEQDLFQILGPKAPSSLMELKQQQKPKLEEPDAGSTAFTAQENNKSAKCSLTVQSDAPLPSTKEPSVSDSNQKTPENHVVQTQICTEEKNEIKSENNESSELLGSLPGSHSGLAETVSNHTSFKKGLPTESGSQILPNPFLTNWTTERVSGFVPVIDNPKKFYVHLVSEVTEVRQDQQANMDQHYNSEASPAPVSSAAVVPGSVWAYRYPTDKQWFRVRVRAVWEQENEAQVVIHFVDRGNELKVSPSSLRPLLPEFCEPTCLAVPCSLAWVCPMPGHTKWATSTIQRMVDVAGSGKLVSLRVEEKNQDGKLEILMWTVDNGTEVLLNTMLVKEGLASAHSRGPVKPVSRNPVNSFLSNGTQQTSKVTSSSSSGNSTPHSSSDDQQEENGESDIVDPKLSIPRVEIPPEETYVYATVSAIFNPAHFYLVFPFGCRSYLDVKPHEYKEEKCLVKLSREMMEFYAKQKLLELKDWTPGIGSVVAVQSIRGDQWFRATVSQHDKDLSHFDVFYLDYGTEERVRRHNIRQLTPEFTKLPAQAVECSMNIRPMSDQGWTPVAQDIFETYVKEQTLLAKILPGGSDDKATVTLFKSQGFLTVDIGMQLVEQLLARKLDEALT